ncbi:hypothetical protein RFI_35818, partial [Reticulomyxa filosa]
EQVMSPDERLRYFQDLTSSKEQELVDQIFNDRTDYTYTRNIHLLRQLLKQSVDLLRESLPHQFDCAISKKMADELNDRINIIKVYLEKADTPQDERAIRVHQRDYDILETLATCLSERKYFMLIWSFICFEISSIYFLELNTCALALVNGFITISTISIKERDDTIDTHMHIETMMQYHHKQVLKSVVIFVIFLYSA